MTQSDLEIEPEDLKRDRRAPQRRCIVTRESMDKEKLLRFVIDPAGYMAPDIAQKLPGRGYWVLCQQEAVQKAIQQRLFLKASRGRARVPEGLVEKVEALLTEHALQALSLASKAGQLVAGFDKVAATLASGQVIALVHGRDAAAGSLEKLPFPQEKRFCVFPSEALSGRLGLENAVHVALLNGPAAQGALNKISRLTGFLQKQAL